MCIEERATVNGTQVVSEQVCDRKLTRPDQATSRPSQYAPGCAASHAPESPTCTRTSSADYSVHHNDRRCCAARPSEASETSPRAKYCWVSMTIRAL